MRVLLTLLLGSLFATQAFAGPKIQQVDTTRNRVAVSSDKDTSIGSEWMATKKDGTQCVLVVDDKIANLAILKPLSCSGLSELRVGQTLTKNLLSTSTKTPSANNESRVVSSQDWSQIREKLRGLSLIGFYSMADDVPFKVNGTSATAIGETAWGFGGEYEYFLGDAILQGLPIAVVGGVTYELSREYTSVKQNGATQQYPGAKPAFSMWDFYANAQLNVTNSVSALAGFNYPVAREENFGDEKLKSSLGYQVGATARLSNQLGVDAMYRWINLKTASLSDMELNGFVLRGRYIF